MVFVLADFRGLDLLRFYCEVCDIDQTVNLTADETPSCLNCGRPLSADDDLTRGKSGAAKFKDLAETRSFQLPQRIGKYRIVSHVATGGFGTVYKGYEGMLDINVAIKVPRADRFSEAQADEFITEARTMAKLEHPNIVPIKDVGKDENGNPYLVMKWIDGCTLGRYVKQNELSYERAAELVAEVAHALHFAHKKGYVHRDLKPGNILIAQEGKSYVTDFGLAIHEERQMSIRNQVAGTLQFMSPEQVKGKSHHLDGRTDIWSLGVVFYQMLTGQKPFSGKSDEIIEQILERDPKPPRQYDSRIPESYEAACLRCLQKKVSNRYSNALDLAEDLVATNDPAKAEPAKTEPAKTVSAKRSISTRFKIAATVIGLAILVPLFAAIIGIVSEPKNGADGENMSPQEKVSEGKAIEKADPEKTVVGQVKTRMAHPSTTMKFNNNDLILDVPEGRGVFTLGELDKDNKSFEISFSSPAGQRRLAIFWGLESTADFQFVMLSAQTEKPNLFRVSRHVAVFDTQIGYRAALPAGGQDNVDLAKLPGARHTIRVLIEDGRLAAVFLNGEKLDDLTLKERSANCLGEFGILMSRSDAIFSDLKIDEVNYALAPVE